LPGQLGIAAEKLFDYCSRSVFVAVRRAELEALGPCLKYIKKQDIEELSHRMVNISSLILLRWYGNLI
jgi:hypothetical protein